MSSSQILHQSKPWEMGDIADQIPRGTMSSLKACIYEQRSVSTSRSSDLIGLSNGSLARIASNADDDQSKIRANN